MLSSLTSRETVKIRQLLVCHKLLPTCNQCCWGVGSKVLVLGGVCVSPQLVWPVLQAHFSKKRYWAKPVYDCSFHCILAISLFLDGLNGVEYFFYVAARADSKYFFCHEKLYEEKLSNLSFYGKCSFRALIQQDILEHVGTAQFLCQGSKAILLGVCCPSNCKQCRHLLYVVTHIPYTWLRDWEANFNS